MHTSSGLVLDQRVALEGEVQGESVVGGSQTGGVFSIDGDLSHSNAEYHPGVTIPLTTRRYPSFFSCFLVSFSFFLRSQLLLNLYTRDCTVTM